MYCFYGGSFVGCDLNHNVKRDHVMFISLLRFLHFYGRVYLAHNMHRSFILYCNCGKEKYKCSTAFSE